MAKGLLAPPHPVVGALPHPALHLLAPPLLRAAPAKTPATTLTTSALPALLQLHLQYPGVLCRDATLPPLLAVKISSSGPFAPPRASAPPAADLRATGCLTHAADQWPRGTWAGRLARRGLSWQWTDHPPRLKLPPPYTRTPLQVSTLLQDMRLQGVLEVHRGPVFLSRPFTVPRRDRPEPRLVVDLSVLNRYITCHRFRMVTLAQVRETLLPGAWFTSLDLANAYWHVPVHPRFRSFMAVQDGETVLRFRVMPFGLNIAPRIFTKLTRTVASMLADEGVSLLMYLDDWLIQGTSQLDAQAATSTTIAVCERLGFAFNIPKCVLTPHQSIDWLGMTWDSTSQSLRLTTNNRVKLVDKLRRAVVAKTYNHKLWASLMGSLTFAAQVVPLGRLWCRRLWWEGNHLFPRSCPHHLHPVPHYVHRLLQQWLDPDLLSVSVPWRCPPPQLQVYTDASDSGWGYQAAEGIQGRGLWSPEDRERHVNVRELMVPLLFLHQQSHLTHLHICFHMDNVAAVQCVRRMGSSRSLPLLRTSESLFTLAASRQLTLSAVHLPGRHNVWADALSRQEMSSVEWSLHPDAFQDLVELFGCPEIDLFATTDNHMLPLYLTRKVATQAGGPDALMTSWATWEYVYLFPPPAAAIMTAVCRLLQNFRGRVLLIAPLWKAQPWCQQLLRWCPRPLPLSRHSILGRGFLMSGMSSDFHAWNFSRNV